MKFLRIVRNAVIMALISISFLALCELLLRSYPEYQYNEEYLISLKPNITRIYFRTKYNGGDIIVWNTNNDSFRGPDVLENPGTRIIVYGDSNVNARFSKEENTFVHKLGEYLRAAGLEDLEVINAGVLGFGPDQSMIRFEKEADKYKPDMVIFHIFADNDFGDIIRNRLFDLDTNDKLKKTEYEKSVDRYLKLNAQGTISDFLSSLLVVRAAKKLALILTSSEKQELKNENTNDPTKDPRDDIIEMYQNLNSAEYSVYKESKPRSFSNFDDHYDIDIALDPNLESSKTKIKLMDEVLKETAEFARTKGITLLVVIQPSIIDCTKDNYQFGYEYLQKYPGYKRSNLSDAVENLCIKDNIEFVNLFEVFMENNPENLFFGGDDNHWNDLGQDIAAQATASYISSHLALGTRGYNSSKNPSN